MSIGTDNRVDVANEVLACFAPGTKIRIESGYVLVSWSDSSGNFEKRWQTRGQDFYPVWYRKWGHGGTASTALSQLARWIRGKNVLPLSTWRYWAGDRCRLLRQGDASKAIQLLEKAGYPECAKCCLCDCELESGFDWWNLDGVSGPCCGMNNGCRQRRPGKCESALPNV